MKIPDGHRESRSAVSNIAYVAGVLGLTNADLARIMGVSKSLFYQRKAKPWTLRLGELEKLAEYARKREFSITAAQLIVPFVPAATEAWEETA